MNTNKNNIYPNKDCNLCPRLFLYRKNNIDNNPNWYNGAVDSFGSINSEILIVGLAPGLKGANKTGRPFTGDYAGDLLYNTLIKFGLAKGKYLSIKNDNLILKNVRITNSVRCAPPQNKPNANEKKECRKFLVSEIKNMKNLKIILSLGRIAHEEILKSYKLTLNKFKFNHGSIHKLNNNIKLINSYHCSKYNTQTKRLTEQMFDNVIKKIVINFGSIN